MTVLVFSALVLILPLAFAETQKEAKKVFIGRTLLNEPPAPRLQRPSGEVVDLTGKPFLSFEWTTEGDPVLRDHYDFRIYRGYKTLASTLLVSEKTKAYKIDVKSDLFKNGERYTWAVRQIYNNGGKSRRNFESFQVVKK